tara:strand:+ start:1928 stop:3472 length:1545 start_codon:yes stop_codon:yes gene_type:complete
MSETIFRTKWYRFSDYEMINGSITPKKNSKIITYDPFYENSEIRKRTNKIKKYPRKSIYDTLLEINNFDYTTEEELNSLLINFTKTWGLLGSLIHNYTEIKLHPMYLPFYTEGLSFNEKSGDAFVKGLIYDHYHRPYDYNLGRNYIIHNCVPAKREGIFSLHINSAYLYGQYQTEYNEKDPTDLNWPKNRNYVHICPQQLSYKLINGRWQVNSRFLTLKKINLKAKQGDLVDTNEIKNIEHFDKPGWTEKFIYPYGNLQEGESSFPFKDENYKQSSKFDSKEYAPTNFILNFPRIRDVMEKKTKGKHNNALASLVEKYFWPMPGTEKFFRNYGEGSLETFAEDIVRLKKDWFDLKKEELNNKKISEANLQRIRSLTEQKLRRFTGGSVPTIEFDKNNKSQYYYHHPSLISIIGHMITQTYFGPNAPRRCPVCDTEVTKIATAKTIWCNGSECGNRLRKAKFDALKKNKAYQKLKKDYAGKKITKKQFEKKKKSIDEKTRKVVIKKLRLKLLGNN